MIDFSKLQQYGIGSIHGAVPFDGGGFVKLADVLKLAEEQRATSAGTQARPSLAPLLADMRKLKAVPGSVWADAIQAAVDADTARHREELAKSKSELKQSSEDFRKIYQRLGEAMGGKTFGQDVVSVACEKLRRQAADIANLEEAVERVRIERDANRTKLDEATDELRAARERLAEENSKIEAFDREIVQPMREKTSALAVELKNSQGELAEAKRALEIVRVSDRAGVWYWQGDGGDEP